MRLDAVFPPGGKAGAETSVTITGAELDDATTLLFSHAGITAVKKDRQFLVKIAHEVPPGIYDARATGPAGLSNPRSFVVSTTPVTSKPAGNHSPDAAVEIAPGSTVVGTTTAAAADWFRFAAKKGTRVFVECDAAGIDSRLSPVLTLSDLSGRELESSRSGLLDFTAPADGTWRIKLHDLTFAGGPSHFYRLTLYTGPRIDFVFPPAARRGVRTKLAIFGRNLPGGVPAGISDPSGKPLEKIETEIEVPATGDTRMDGLTNPASAWIDGFTFRLSSPHGASNGVFIGFAETPAIAEREGEPLKISPPVEVAGQFFPATDNDVFTFDAKKGDVWWLEVISHRAGMAVSPFILIQREGADAQETYGSETNAGGPRFSTLSNDPALRFEAKEDGAYRVTLRDLFGGTRKDPRNTYRLIIRKESPDFRLIALAEPPPEKKDDRSAAPRAPLLRAGGTVPLRVIALRRDGFKDAIELRAEGLPPGVSCAPQRIPAGATEGVLLLAAEPTVQRWAGAIRIGGKAGSLVHEARGGAVRWAVTDWNNDPVQARLTRDITLGVSEDRAPVSVIAGAGPWEAAPGSKLEIPLKIARTPEFKEALKLKAYGMPGLDAVKEIDVAPTAGEAKAVIDLAATKLPAGEHTIHFQSQTKGKFRGKDVTTTIFSTPIRIVVKQP